MTSSNTIEQTQTPDGSTGKIQKTIGYFLTYIALGLVSAALGPTLPGLAAQTGSALSQISYLFTARMLGDMIGAFGVSRLYDRVRGHPLMGAMLLLLAMAMVLIPITPLLWVLIIIILLGGIASGTLDVGCNILLVWLHKPNIGPFMNALHFFFGVGAFISPVIIARLLLFKRGLSLPYWVIAAVILPIGVYVLRLSSPVNKDIDEKGAFQKVNPLLIVLVAVLFGLYCGAEVGFGGWIYTFTIKMNLAGEATAALLTSIFWGGLTAGRMFSIPIATRVPPPLILLGDLLGCVLSLLVILFLPFHTAGLWIGTAGMGLCMASVFPTLLSFAERRMVISGKVTGYLFLGASLGGMSLPLVIGQLFVPLGPLSVMYAILIDLLFALLIFAALMRYARKGEGRRD